MRDRLLRICELAGGGSELERDLALQLLREVYAEIKFGAVAEEEAAGTAGFPLLDKEECRPQDDGVVESPIMPRRVAPELIRSLYGSEEESDLESGAADCVAKPVVPSSIAAVHNSAGDELSPAFFCDTVTSPDPDSTTDSIVIASPTGLSDTPHQPRGESHEPPTEPIPEPTQEPAKTIGDAIAAPKTLGESIKPGAAKTVGESSPTEGLKRSIGLNDRFLMIRDMFGGDAGAFDEAITRLDAFTSLDEAVIWIRDNFDWRADSPGVALLVGLLERKLKRS